MVYYKDFEKESNPLLVEMGQGSSAGLVVIHLMDDPLDPFLGASAPVDSKYPKE